MKVKKTALHNMVLVFLLIVVLSPGCSARVSPTSQPKTAVISTVPTTTLKGKTFIVTSPADSGPDTLRHALLFAHNGDTITFDPAFFPPNVPVTIALSSGLTPITQGNLTIDASNAGVILDGANITDPSTDGLSVSSNGNTIRGLQIVNFPGHGVALQDGAQNNTIGGDQKVGIGLLGQGNLVSGNKADGIGISDGSRNTIMGNYIGTDISGTIAWGNGAGIDMNGTNYNNLIGNLISGNKSYGIQLFKNSTHNTITGNLVGTDASGKNALGNQATGIAFHDGANQNTVGPNNVVAYNDQAGIFVQNKDSIHNTITRNSIHDNSGPGIGLPDGGNIDILAPFVRVCETDLGSVAIGWAGANCTIELFSDTSNEGKIYEGTTTTDGSGNFLFDKNTPFAGPLLTATVTDIDGNTSTFSTPISVTLNTRKLATLQEGNSLQVIHLLSKFSGELADNRIGSIGSNMLERNNATQFLSELTSYGIKRFKWSLNEVDANLAPDGRTILQIDWSESEFDIPQVPGGPDDFAAGLVNIGIISTYVLTFWDKANHPEGWQTPPGYSRFKTEEEIQRYLDYVRFVVRHFKGRVQYYEIWNESAGGAPIHYIAVDDYINLVRRTIPIIRQEDPAAKIVVGSVVIQDPSELDYLLSILKSDIIPLVDVISWHPMFSVSPELYSNYYYHYPSIVQEIKDVASAHGFMGEYRAEEIFWNSPDNIGSVAEHDYSNTIAAKYYARGIVMHLGMDLTVGISDMSSMRTESFTALRNLSTLMAGAKSTQVSLDIQSSAANIRTYSFSLPDGSQLVALWTDGVAVDDDPGVKAEVTIHNVSAQKVTGIDVLNSFEQPLVVSSEGTNLVIHNLLIKDYPIFLYLLP